MSGHLSPQQFVDAAEGTLSASTTRHLHSCARCREDLAALGDVMRDAQDARDVPEPSPLFWDHFSARVRSATDEVTVPRPSWTWWRRPAVATAAIALLTTVVVIRRTPPAPVDVPGEVVALAPASLGAEFSVDDSAWDLVVTLASGLSSEDIHQMTPPAVGGSDLVESLTPAEREAFVRLVKQEMGGVE